MTRGLTGLCAAGLLILAAGILAGCGCTSLIERDTPVSRSLEEFSRTGPDGATRRLDELTDFAWDRVYFFTREFTSNREINAAVGEEVFDGCIENPAPSQEDYLIFTLRGKVVHAVRVLSTVGGDKQTYPRSAVIRAVARYPAPYFLELVDRR